MGKSKELSNTKEIVKSILETDEKTRNSDMVLYVKVCEKLNPEVLSEPFWYVLVNLKEYNLPSIETVRRTRQKMQEMHPELAASSNVEAQRMLNEEVFRNFARGVIQ